MPKASRLSPTLRRAFRVPVYLYRWKCGWLLGHRFLLLIHFGRRTGRRHETVLEIMEYRSGGPEWIVMSGFGPRANWLLNIQSGPAPLVVVGRRSLIAEHRFLSATEAMSVLARYERRHRLMSPAVRLVLSRLLGWAYRGTEDDRRRAVVQLPIVALRPQSRIPRPTAGSVQGS